MMVALEPDIEEHTIGDCYARDNKSLKSVEA